MVAFSMRRVPNREGTEISHVLLCNVTQRVSFWFVVTDPSRNHTLPAVEVQSAIRMNRNRINNAFFLNDQTLEFLRIPATLAPPTDPSVPIWIIIFGVIFCIVIVATMLLILSGIRQHRRKNKGPSEMEDTEDKWENTVKIENGIPCDPLDMKGGHVNDAFVTEDERLTPLWRAAVLFPPETQHLFLCNCWTSQFIEGRLYILFHHSSFVRNFECAWNWKAMNYTHEDHWNNKLLTIQNILKYFSNSTVCRCSHVAFVVTDFKMH